MRKLIILLLFQLAFMTTQSFGLTIDKNTPIKVNLHLKIENQVSKYIIKEIKKTLKRASFNSTVKMNSADKDFLITCGTLDQAVIQDIYERDFNSTGITNDGFFVKITKNNIFIGSSQPRGIIYGFNDILEKHFSFSWVRPGEMMFPPTKVPVDLQPQKYTSSPAYAMRGFAFNGYSGYQELSADWALANRINFNSMGIRLWNLDNNLLKRVERNFLIRTTGHSFYFWLPFRYFKTNPEYFPLIKGKRTPYPKPTYATQIQLNTGNEEVIKLVAENIKQFHREHPHFDWLPLVMNDGYGWCESPEARAYDDPDEYKRHVYSTRYIKFANRVTEEVVKEFPNLKIVVLAYLTCAEPPKVKPHKNIIIGFCTYRRCYKYTIDDPRSAANSYLLKNLKGWLAFGNEVFIRDYHVFGGLPKFQVPLLKTFQHDLIFFKKLGIKSYYTEALVDGAYQQNDHYDKKYYYKYTPGKLFDYWTGMKLNYYLMTKLLWNPKQDIDELTRCYFSSYFGEAGQSLYKIYQRTEKLWFQNQAPYIWNKYTTDFGRLIFKNTQDIEAVKKDAQIALEKAKKQNDEIYLKRTNIEIEQINNVWFKNYSKMVHKRISLFKYSGPKNMDNLKKFAVEKNSVSAGFITISGKEPELKTTFYAAYTKKELLILVEGDNKGNPLKIVPAAHDSAQIWQNSTIELFINSGPQLQATKSGYFHFGVTPGGSTYDAFFRSSKWESSFNAITRTNSTSWSVLFAIPLKSIGYHGKSGEQIQLNIGRTQKDTEKDTEVSSWTDGSYHNPASFGVFELN